MIVKAYHLALHNHLSNEIRAKRREQEEAEKKRLEEEKAAAEWVIFLLDYLWSCVYNCEADHAIYALLSTGLLQKLLPSECYMSYD